MVQQNARRTSHRSRSSEVQHGNISMDGNSGSDLFGSDIIPDHLDDIGKN